VRRRLVEDPVLQAEDVSPEDWAELRRRFGEESRYLEEMFGLRVEARAEGAASIDVDGGCTDIAFPAGGTTAHAALLLLDVLTARHRGGADPAVLQGELRVLVQRYGRFWRRDVDPQILLPDVVGLLAAMTLVTIEPDGRVGPRPVAARFAPVVAVADADDDGEQQSLL
jgi:uncharacterized protein (TIGR02678 family)